MTTGVALDSGLKRDQTVLDLLSQAVGLGRVRRSNGLARLAGR
jgi:hypothetical protein